MSEAEPWSYHPDGSPVSSLAGQRGRPASQRGGPPHLPRERTFVALAPLVPDHTAWMPYPPGLAGRRTGGSLVTGMAWECRSIRGRGRGRPADHDQLELNGIASSCMNAASTAIGRSAAVPE